MSAPAARAVAKHFNRDGRRPVYDVHATHGARILVSYHGSEDEFGVLTAEPDTCSPKIWATARRFTVTPLAGPSRVAV